MTSKTEYKTVMVTGGAGFIGSHLAERLLVDGHTVKVLDNFSTGRMENLDQVKDNPRLLVHLCSYALTKYLGEQYVLHWNKVYKLPCVSLRLFNVYCSRSRTSGTYGAVFSVFLAQKLAGKPFTVVGDGTQTRDFTFVTDVVDAFVGAAESKIEGDVLNVGSGYTYSVNYLVGLLGGDMIHFEFLNWLKTEYISVK